MNTACMKCRTSGPNLLDKPTGRLICVKCGAEIPISDTMRNAIAKKGMFLANQKTQPVQSTAAIPMRQPSSMEQVATRPVVRPKSNDQQSAMEAARTRLAKIQRNANMGPGDSGSKSEEIRYGVVSLPPRKSRQEAAADKQSMLESFVEDAVAFEPTRHMPERNFVREELSNVGLDVDRLDAIIKKE